MTKHFCDICGREVDTVKSKPFLISFGGFYKNDRIFDICIQCETVFENTKNRAEVDFMKHSYWWEQNSNGDGEIDYGTFKQVGTCEQGGIMCPKCGHSNNSYIFDGTCQKCGYKKT